MDLATSFSQRFSMERWVPLFLALTLFALPLSSTGKSVFLSLSVVAVLLTPAYRRDLASLIATTWCKTAIALFCLVLAGSMWSPASFSEKLFSIEKYSKLLYLPILVIGFRDKNTRQVSLHAFLLAMFITSVLATLKFNGYLQSLAIDPDRIFRNHIIVGFMGSLAAYLSALFFYRQPGISRLGYGLLFLLFSYHMLFVNAGRAGYVIYLLLLVLLMIQICSWRKAGFAILFMSLVFIISYTQNSVMKQRVNLAVIELSQYQKNSNKNTSIGYRLQFHDFAHELFNNHPIFGNGTASFTYYFRTENPVPAWNHTLLEPHSQYWLMASEWGVLGLGALLLFFISLSKAAWQLNVMRPIAFAVMLPFLLGNLSDSLLFYSGPGYLFILLMALCLGESVERITLNSTYAHQTPGKKNKLFFKIRTNA